MSKDELQKLAFEQQVSLLASAHSQVLKLLFEDQRIKLSLENALSYLKLMKMKLGEAEFNEFQQLLTQTKSANCDIMNILWEIVNLLQGDPELIQGFGMFLPPSLNVQLQTGGIRLFNAAKTLSNFTETRDMEKESDKPEEENMVNISVPEEGNSSEATKTWVTNIDKKELNVSKEVDDAYAISFLNKVKERFQDQPTIYQRFLDMLDSVRQDSSGTHINIEMEMFEEVSELFQGNEDLLEEFKTFVPNASFGNMEHNLNEMTEKRIENANEISDSDDDSSPDFDFSKYTAVNDQSIAPVYKWGSYDEHLFFDKVRSTVGHRKVFDNFLRCLMLYNEDVVSRSEVLKLATSFLGKFPDLLRQFKDMLGFDESGYNIETIPMRIVNLENRRNDPEVALDIDYATGGRTGASYRALPKDYEQPKCSGRNALCNEVLNDTWVSFPSWSEDSTFVTSCKTQYEEIIYRCEDERFELDMAISANSHTMELVESLQKKINKMTAEEKSTFFLDDYLGGNSCIIHQKALHRLYGDKTEELVEGLKRNPVVAVPIILKRLKVKEDEWKEKEAYFNTIWRDQIDKFYLKSLDHQGINFKQNDSKSFRSKSLLNELDMVYAEQKENHTLNSSAHYILEFKDMSIFQDAINLMLQYLKKLPGVYRDDRRRIEMLIRSFIPDLFCAPSANIPIITIDDENVDRKRNGMEDEEGESKENEDPMETGSNFDENSPPSPTGSGRDEGSSELDESNSNEENEISDESNGTFMEESDVFDKIDPLPITNMPYTLFFISKTWYIFFRQFHILCERLSRLLFESNRQDLPVKLEEDTTDEEGMSVKMQKQPSYREIIENLSLLLSGSIDYPQFEELARSLFGIHAYISFTMDKLVLNIVRQLQQVVTDDICKQTTAYFVQHMKTVSTSGFSSPLEASLLENDYLRKVEKIIEDEKCFKILWHKKDLTMTIQLIEHEIEESSPDPCEAEKWSDYLDSFVNEDSVSDEFMFEMQDSTVFLKRNLRKQMEYWKNKVALVERMWQTRHSTNFIKRNVAMFNKKRKAIAIANSALNLSKVMRSSVQESSPHDASCSSATANDCDQLDEAIPSPETIPDLVSFPQDPDETDSGVKNDAVSEEVDLTERSEIVVVDLSSEHTSVQEESVHDTEPIEEIKCDEVMLERDIDLEPMEIDPGTENAGTTCDDSNADNPHTANKDAEPLNVDSTSCSSIVSVNKKDCSKEDAVIHSCEENVSDSKKLDDASPQDVEPQDDLSSQIIKAVEAASRIIETIADEGSSADKAVASDSESVGKPEDADAPPTVSPIKSKNDAARRRIIRRPADYSIRTRKNRIYQNYVKRRLRRSIVRSVQTTYKGKRKRVAKPVREDFEDVFFDYACFSQLSEKDKIYYMAARNVDIDDNTQATFAKGSYRMYFVVNSYTYFVRRGVIARAKEIHQSISEIKTSNFNSWHRIWLERYVTQSMYKCCNDWMLRSDPERFKLVHITVSNCTKPPYIPYNKYKVRYYKKDTTAP